MNSFLRNVHDDYSLCNKQIGVYRIVHFIAYEVIMNTGGIKVTRSGSFIHVTVYLYHVMRPSICDI